MIEHAYLCMHVLIVLGACTHTQQIFPVLGHCRPFGGESERKLSIYNHTFPHTDAGFLVSGATGLALGNKPHAPGWGSPASPVGSTVGCP